ncbi:MAG: TraR/DksA C4-type zinc finger protein [Desulfarculaceae bacterium]|nr:TraR/DksA C4-type zinc finger protein [Desulfarculaceae bacterium]
MDAEQVYMNSDQLAYFKNKLFSHREELSEKISRTVKKIQQLKSSDADILDRSNVNIHIEREVKASERYSRYLRNIETALSKIEDGSYGFCELTGTKIGLKRLQAQPWATLSIKALEELEEARQKGRPVSKAFA